MKKMRMGEVLVRCGYVSEEQLANALAYQKESRSGKRIGEILLELGYITSKQHLVALGRHLGLEAVDLKTYHIDELAVEKIPKQIAEKYSVLAIQIDGSHLTVAISDPLDLYAVEDIRLVTNMQIKLALTEKSGIDRAIDLYYSEIDARMAATRANQHAGLPDSILGSVSVNVDDEQAPIVRLLNSLLLKGYNTNVSDIHIEPFETETIIRMRRDGLLLPYMTLASALHQGLVARTKILAQMDIAEKRRPQDGHFKLQVEDVELNIRVSFIPTAYGEKGVLRFLTSNAPIDDSDTFGMSEENYKRMSEMLKKPYGIIYFTGPTGSGKTTTLYSILQYMRTKPVNIITIEDPVERNIPKLNQMQVNERAGITFESGLRAILRQDPDIIMIGETRDYETASISARAAITGHLVFSTLHTNDAVSSVIRLQDMGLPPYMIANSITGIVAQRLMRKICPYCGEEYEADARELELLRETKTPVILRRGKGCHLCNDTGYLGRTAIYQILEIDSGFRRLVAREQGQEELQQYASKQLQMTTLWQEAKKLVLEGVTSVSEMEKVTYRVD